MKFLSTLCIAALCSAIFRMLVPENKFSKQISLLIAGVFLLTAISAISGAELDLSAEPHIGFAEDYGAEFSDGVNKELKRKICGEMSDKIYALLNAREIYPQEIHIAVNISGLYSIDITQVELVFKSGEQAAANAAAEILGQELPPQIAIKTDVKE